MTMVFDFAKIVKVEGNMKSGVAQFFIAEVQRPYVEDRWRFMFCLSSCYCYRNVKIMQNKCYHDEKSL